MRIVTTLLFVMMVLTSVFSIEQSQARPLYLAEFVKQYPKVQGNELKCQICHSAEDKKIRNIYGFALETKLSGKNIKIRSQILDALTEAEKLPSAIAGKTFGDLLKEGIHPAITH